MSVFRCLLIVGLLFPVGTQADLRDTLLGLYGGDGITLRNTGFFNHAAHFTGESLTQLNDLSGRATRIELPIISVDSGSVFEFDPIIEDFVEVPGQLGSMFAERPQSLGRGRISIGFNYQEQNFSRFDGEELDDLQVLLAHTDVGGPGIDICIGGPPGACYFFEEDQIAVDLDVELNVRTLALYADFGLSDRFDVGIVVPMIDTDLKATASAHVIESPTAQFFPARTLHSFDPAGVDGDSAISRVSDSHTGLGDILLRSKWHALSRDSFNLSVGSQLRLPTGDYRELQGTGRVGGRVALLASWAHETRSGIWVPHANLAYDLNTSADGADQVQLVVGFDYGFRAWSLESSVAVDVVHRIRTNRRSGSGDETSELALGYKWRWGGSGSMFFGARLPLDRNDGLRTDTTFELGGQLSI